MDQSPYSDTDIRVSQWYYCAPRIVPFPGIPKAKYMAANRSTAVSRQRFTRSDNRRNPLTFLSPSFHLTFQDSLHLSRARSTDHEIPNPPPRDTTKVQYHRSNPLPAIPTLITSGPKLHPHGHTRAITLRRGRKLSVECQPDASQPPTPVRTRPVASFHQTNPSQSSQRAVIDTRAAGRPQITSNLIPREPARRRMARSQIARMRP